MSVTIAQRPHVQVPWLPIIVVLAMAAAAALVLVLSIQASTSIPAATSAATLGTAGASVWTAAEPRKRPPVVRAIVSGEMPVTAPAETPAPLRKSIHTPWLAGGGASSSR
ncbi:MAG: hypothetical protein NTW58_05035 [Actinobacteria bacterium]|nr:hypothetical protein [Actinomycetota bacterium]